MRRLVVIAAALIVTATAGVAQSPIPDLKGTWKGTGKILLFGTTEHLTGSPQNAVVRDLEVTHTVAGQDGPLIWGTTSSANNDSKEPFAWALSQDNKTIVALIPMAITGSRFCRPTRSKSVTRKTPWVPGRRSSPRASS